MTDKKKDSNERTPTITITFTDGKIWVHSTNVSPGQFASATIQLLAMSLYDVLGQLSAQAYQAAQQEAQMQMAVKKVMETKQ